MLALWIVSSLTVEPIYSEAGGLEGVTMMDIYDEPDRELKV